METVDPNKFDILISYLVFFKFSINARLNLKRTYYLLSFFNDFFKLSVIDKMSIDYVYRSFIIKIILSFILFQC